jgi:hypothetical protein
MNYKAAGKNEVSYRDMTVGQRVNFEVTLRCLARLDLQWVYFRVQILSNN